MLTRITFFALFLIASIQSSLAQGSPCALPVSVAEARSAGDYNLLQTTQQLLSQCQAHPDSQALVFHSLGVWKYNVDGSLDSAIYFMRQAVETWSKVAPLVDTLGAAKSNFNLGYFLKDQERYLEAEPFLRRAASWYALIGADARLLFAYLQLGQVQENNGAYTKAADFYRLAMKVAYENEDQLGQAKALNDLGGLLSRQKEYEAALDTLQRALQLFQLSEDDPDLPACQNQLGVLYAEMGDHQQSVKYFTEALRGFEDWDECRRAALVANNLGDEYLFLGDLPKAYQTLSTGLEQANACESPEIIAQSFDHLGEYYLRVQKLQDAETAFLTAIQTLVPSWDGQSPATTLLPLLPSNPHKLDIFIYMRDLARAKQERFRQSGQSDQALTALSWYQLADQLSDELRAGHYDEANKLFWREQVLPFYETAISCALSVEAVDIAHVFFEKSQAILLYEAVEHARKLSRLPEDVRQQEQRLKSILRRTRNELMLTGPDSQQQGADVLAAEDALTEFYQKLSASYPEFSAGGQGLVIEQLSTFEERYLQPESLSLVQYFWGQDRLYALSVQNGDTRLVDLGPVSTLSESVAEMLGCFSSASRLVEDPQAYAELSHALFQAVLAPVFERLPAKLLIVPSGPLAYLPFEALVTEILDVKSGRSKYLIESTRTSYAYSASLHAQLHDVRSQSDSKRVFAMAPFSVEGANGFPALPNSELELNQLQNVFAGDYFFDESASRARFLSDASSFALLHLSTHAQSVSDRAQPFIAFQDSLVWLSDLYGLHLPAELVVLSACQTNTGELAQGEGVLGLGRGFFHAGARSVIASLWNLNDRHTAQIIRQFYEELAAGTPKPEALHRAKLTFLKDNSIPAFQRTPYYWAGLSFYGNHTALALEPKSTWVWPALFLVLGLVCTLVWWLRKRRGSE